MNAWNFIQARNEMGAEHFNAWCSARQRSAFSHCLTPKICERRAKAGDPGAIETMQRFQVELITRRLKG